MLTQEQVWVLSALISGLGYLVIALWENSKKS